MKNWTLALAIGTAVTTTAITLCSQKAYAVDVPVENGKKFTIKLPNTPYQVKNGISKGKVSTTFNFHPVDLVTTDFTKNTGTLTINPNPITQNYSLAEIHGTSGSVTYDLTLSKFIDLQNKEAFLLTSSGNAKINPGKAEPPLRVTINSKINDPFTFSDSDPNATFGFVPSGLDYSFSLFKGTTLVPNTSLNFIGRLAPSVISEPDSFWSNGVSGAIDLFTLAITSNINNVIDAQLSFGASTSNFSLDFKNNLGVSFDPTIPANVTSIENLIEAAFSNGQLISDLPDVFTVGFIPSANVTEFTLGSQDTIDAEDIEKTPEPNSTISLFALGTLGAGATLKRKLKQSKSTEKETTKVS